jgi:spore coat protein CotH
VKKQRYTFLLSSVALLASCSFSLSSTTSNSASSLSTFSGTLSSSTSDTSYPSLSSNSQLSDAALQNSEEYLAFWSPSSDLQMSLTMTTQAMADLSKYQSDHDVSKYFDVYFPATFHLSLNGTAYDFEDVGVRMKGNTSRRTFCDSTGAISNAVHFKVSFKATFDGVEYDLNNEMKLYKHDWSADAAGLAARKKRTLFGMEKIDLKYVPRNLNEKPGCVAQEIYCYNAFSSEGLLAPRANLAKVTLKNDAATKAYTYEVVEPIDKVFLKRHFTKAESKGDLYKCVYGKKGTADLNLDDAVSDSKGSDNYQNGTRIADGKIGVEDNIKGYHPSYDLGTNDDAGNSGTFSTLVNYINIVHDCVYNGAAASRLEGALDIDEFLHFSAVSWLLGNFDSERYNANNYYLYFRPSDGKAIYIPYDWDWSLGMDMTHKMVNLSAFDESTLGSPVVAIYYATFFKSQILSYSKVAYQKSYLGYLKSGIANGVLKYENYTALNSSFKYATGQELATVKSYMSTRISVLNKEF